MKDKKIGVLVYEDNTNLRGSISTMLDWSDVYTVVAALPECSHVLHDISVCHPDVILMDIDMPPTNGIEALLQLRPAYPELPVIMLTVFEDNDHIIQSICAGASGYLLKKDIDQVIPAIKDVMSGGAPMTSSVARKVLQLFPQVPVKKEDVTDQLTNRENEILQWLVKGYSYKMIAAELFLSVDTIRSHIKNIYRKLQVSSAVEAIYKLTHTKS